MIEVEKVQDARRGRLHAVRRALLADRCVNGLVGAAGFLFLSGFAGITFCGTEDPAIGTHCARPTRAPSVISYPNTEDRAIGVRTPQNALPCCCCPDLEINSENLNGDLF